MLLEQHLPTALTALRDVGAVKFNMVAESAKLLPTARVRDLSRFARITTCRRRYSSSPFLTPGRRSPVPRLLEAVGARHPKELVEDAGFVYNTRFYHGDRLPEVRGDISAAVGSISMLTMPATATPRP